jgi:hypothetical protein
MAATVAKQAAAEQTPRVVIGMLSRARRIELAKMIRGVQQQLLAVSRLRKPRNSLSCRWNGFARQPQALAIALHTPLSQKDRLSP